MVLDASKPHAHRDILTRELESVGIRLNRPPPAISLKKRKTGGIHFNSTVPITHLDEKMVHRILQVLAVFYLKRAWHSSEHSLSQRTRTAKYVAGSQFKWVICLELFNVCLDGAYLSMTPFHHFK